MIIAMLAIITVLLIIGLISISPVFIAAIILLPAIALDYAIISRITKRRKKKKKKKNTKK